MLLHYKIVFLILLTLNLKTFCAEKDQEKKLFSAPMFDAVIKNDINLLNRLYKKDPQINQQNAIGYTPLHTAIRYRHDDSVRWLLLHGAETEVNDNEGLTPLWHAISYEYVTGMKLLLLHGANFCHSYQKISLLEHVLVPTRHHLLKKLLLWGTWPPQSFSLYVKNYLPEPLQLVHFCIQSLYKHDLVTTIPFNTIDRFSKSIIHYGAFCLSLAKKKYLAHYLISQCDESQRQARVEQIVGLYTLSHIQQWTKALEDNQELLSCIDIAKIKQHIKTYYCADRELNNRS